MTQSLIQTIEALPAQGGPLLESARENLLLWLKGEFLPDWAERSLQELVGEDAWEELNDRFFRTLAFGTGGMRGRTVGKVASRIEAGERKEPAYPAVGSNYLNDFNVVKATIGLFRYVTGYLQDEGRGYEMPRLAIAHDVRYFSRHFCELAASTWGQLGGGAQIFEGPRSTPQLSFTVRYTGAHAGIVITASHNPPHDNGYKVYFEDGAQVVPPHASGIVDQVNKVDWKDVAKLLDKDLSNVRTLPKSLDAAYRDSIKGSLANVGLIRDFPPKVVFTSIHGTGRVASIPLLEELGVEVLEVEEQATQDGAFPTVPSPNPENTEALQMAIDLATETGADALVGTDPDADRMGAAVRDRDGKMQVLTGNMIGSMLAEYRITLLKENGVLPKYGSQNAALIKTFVTTPLQEAIAKAHGVKLINTLTGFKWIGEKLRLYENELRAKFQEQNLGALDYDATPAQARAKLLLEHSTFYIFGGEESYGYLASDAVRDKDANAAVAMFCELGAWLRSKGTNYLDYLDSLYTKYGYYFEMLGNVYYEGASGSRKIQAILDSYQSNPPQGFAGRKVDKFQDFATGDFQDADGQPIPKEKFFFLELEGGFSFAVRGSGTEPKIKFYVFGRGDVASLGALPEAKVTTEMKVQDLLDAIVVDAKARAEG
jgi:phosphoglucomutase